MDAKALQELTAKLLAERPGWKLDPLISRPVSAEQGGTDELTGYAFYDPTRSSYGDTWYSYAPDGSYIGEAQFKKPGNAFQLAGQFAKDMAPLALAALGANGLGAMLGQPSVFGAGGLLGGGEAGSLTSGVTPGSVSAFEAGLPGEFGVGSLTAGVTPAAVSAFEAGLPATTLGGALTTAAGAGAAGGLLKAALPIAGAVLGGTSGGKTTTSNTTKEMDPRLANYVYGADGTGGLLGSATKLFNDQMATGGLNELQRQGIDMQKNYLLNPAYAQGYTNMMNVGQGLLGGGVAGNPFRR